MNTVEGQKQKSFYEKGDTFYGRLMASAEFDMTIQGPFRHVSLGPYCVSVSKHGSGSEATYRAWINNESYREDYDLLEALCRAIVRARRIGVVGPPLEEGLFVRPDELELVRQGRHELMSSVCDMISSLHGDVLLAEMYSFCGAQTLARWAATMHPELLRHEAHGCLWLYEEIIADILLIAIMQKPKIMKEYLHGVERVVALGRGFFPEVTQYETAVERMADGSVPKYNFF